MPLPLVSIIIATYNRSNIIGYVIQSVLNQSIQDWELLVVGDACTDDTAAVVAAVGDARVRYLELAQNVGEQSGPNNAGLAAANGTYLAFLNHDDFWFPDHLATALALFDRQPDTDFSTPLQAIINPDCSVFLLGLFEHNSYRPNYFVPASGWVFHRRVLLAVPTWRSYRDLWLFPSHDYLRRVFRAGLTIRSTNHLTCVGVPSSFRKNSYRDRQHDEHAHYANQLTSNTNWRTDLLTSALMNNELQLSNPAILWQLLKNIIKRPFVQRNLVPMEWWLMLLHLRKGESLRRLRQLRGLHTLPH